MAKDLFCAKCTVLVATVIDASLRKDLVVYCGPCNNALNAQIRALENARKSAAHEMPDFMKGIFN